MTARYTIIVNGATPDRAYQELLEAVSETGKCRSFRAPGIAGDLLSQMMSEGKIDPEKARTDLLASNNSAVQGALSSALVKHFAGNNSVPGLAFDLEQVYKGTSDDTLKAWILMTIPGVDQDSSGYITLSLGADVLNAYPSQPWSRCRTVAHAFAYLSWKQPARIPELKSTLLKFILREEVPKEAWFPAAEALWSFYPSAITENRFVGDGRLKAAEDFFREHGTPNILRPPQ